MHCVFNAAWICWCVSCCVLYIVYCICESETNFIEKDWIEWALKVCLLFWRRYRSFFFLFLSLSLALFFIQHKTSRTKYEMVEKCDAIEVEDLKVLHMYILHSTCIYFSLYSHCLFVMSWNLEQIQFSPKTFS